jgi:type IV secretion system protein VirB11
MAKAKKVDKKLRGVPRLLHAYLAPLEKYLSQSDTYFDLCVQKEGQVCLKTISGNPEWEIINDPKVKISLLYDLGRTLAAFQGQKFSDEHPILATSIPGYNFRILSMAGSVVGSGFCLSIRMGMASKYPLESYFKNEDLKRVHDILEKGQSMAVVGGTGSGKTTLINSMLDVIDQDKRVITIEDSAELAPPHENWVQMLKSKSGTDLGQVTYKDMINASLRLRPDIILVGELDIDNTMPFLRIINTGHSGCMTTLHADGPEEAFEAMAMNAALCGYNEATAFKYAKKALQYVVFIRREKSNFLATLHKVKK